MSSLKIKNKYLVGLTSWLNSLSLAGSESRERTRFVQMAVERIREYLKYQEEITDKYCEKGEDGKKKTEEKNGQLHYIVIEGKKEEFEKEVNDLLEEEYVMDSSDGNKSKLKTVKNLVLNTEFKFGPKDGDSDSERIENIRQANEYNEWAEAFEKVEIE